MLSAEFVVDREVTNDGAWIFFTSFMLFANFILLNVIIGIINAAQVFAVPVLLTGEGPERSTYFQSMYVYDNAFKFGDMGYASALGVLQFAIILLLTGAVLLAGRKLVYYRGA